MQFIDYILEQIAKGNEDTQRLRNYCPESKCMLAEH